MQKNAVACLSARESQKTWEDIINLCNQRGLHKPVLLRATVAICFFASILMITMYFAWTSRGWIGIVLGSVIISLCMSQLAFWGHNAGHDAISRRRQVNGFLGQLSMNFLCGLAFEEWRDRHRKHHYHVQQDGVDPDMLIDFVASVTVESKRSKSSLAQKIGRWQHIYIWLLSLIFGHSQRFLSQWGVLEQPQKYLKDLLVLALHYGVFIGLPIFLGIAIDRVLIIYFLPTTILGPHLAAVFWVNHIGKPLVPKSSSLHNFEQQVITARTIDNPPQWDWFFGGLNFQIEHHVYPAIPSIRLREMQKIVRPMIEASPLPYDFCSWKVVMIQVYKHFHFVAHSEPCHSKKFSA